MKSTMVCVLLVLATPFTLSADHADSVDVSVPATSGKTLDVRLATGGDLVIDGWNGDSARVMVTHGKVQDGPSAGDDSTDVRVDSDGAGGLRVITAFRNPRNARASDLDVYINVPRHFNVRLSSAGGSVTIRGVEGEFRGLSMGGEYRLGDLRGKADLQTLGGDVVVRHSALSGRVSTNGGQVVLEDVTGGLQVESRGGAVRVSDKASVSSAAGAAAKPDPVVITSNGGPLDIDGAPNGADLRTEGGKVHVHRAGKFVKAVTAGGDIAIDQVDGKVDAYTRGGDIAVTLAGSGAPGSHAIQLHSEGGVLRLAVPPDLPMEVQAEIVYTRDSRRDYKIHSDFPLKIEESPDWDTSDGRPPRKVIRATGRIGAATQPIVLRTVNGDIYLTRGAAAAPNR
jgi:hypothetical protein